MDFAFVATSAPLRTPEIDFCHEDSRSPSTILLESLVHGSIFLWIHRDSSVPFFGLLFGLHSEELTCLPAQYCLRGSANGSTKQSKIESVP